MEGKAATTLPGKLGIQEGSRVAIQHAPDAFALELPPGARVALSARGTVDVILAFFTEAAALERELHRLRNLMEEGSALWIAWPKKSAKTGSDLSENVVRELGLAMRLVDNKVCAIDDTWSALRLVIRREERGTPPA